MRAGVVARLAIAGCALLLLAACASFTPGNPPLAKYAPDAGYRFERLDQGDNSDELFVIVSFSGGGTRAAALAYGVLEALRDAGIEWRGRKVALLDISKPRGDLFLNRLEERLTKAGASVKRYKKPTFTKPAPVDLRHQIASECGAVIEALAD